MLQNAYLEVKIGFDTEENEPSKVFNFFNFHPPQGFNYHRATPPSFGQRWDHMYFPDHSSTASPRESEISSFTSYANEVASFLLTEEFFLRIAHLFEGKD